MRPYPCAAVGDRRFTYGSVFQGAASDRGGPAANAMTSLIDADLLTEAAADLLAVALQLNPAAGLDPPGVSAGLLVWHPSRAAS